MEKLGKIIGIGLLVVWFSACSKEKEVPVPEPEITLSQDANVTFSCQPISFNSGGKTVVLGPAITKYVLLGFKKGTKTGKKESVIARYPLLHDMENGVTDNHYDIMFVPIHPVTHCADFDNLIADLHQDTDIEYVGQYITDDPTLPNFRSALSYRFYVTLRSTSSVQDLHRQVSKTRTNYEGKLNANTYIIRMSRQSAGDYLSLLNQFDASGHFDAVEPDYIWR